jgi:hypothetical protein
MREQLVDDLPSLGVLERRASAPETLDAGPRENHETAEQRRIRLGRRIRRVRRIRDRTLRENGARPAQTRLRALAS